jgi:hypothetical protein
MSPGTGLLFAGSLVAANRLMQQRCIEEFRPVDIRRRSIPPPDWLDGFHLSVALHAML